MWKYSNKLSLFPTSIDLALYSKKIASLLTLLSSEVENKRIINRGDWDNTQRNLYLESNLLIFLLLNTITEERVYQLISISSSEI